MIVGAGPGGKVSAPGRAGMELPGLAGPEPAQTVRGWSSRGSMDPSPPGPCGSFAPAGAAWGAVPAGVASAASEQPEPPPRLPGCCASASRYPP